MMATNEQPQAQTAIAYVRVSTGEQIEGVSLEAQESALRAYCDMRGMALVDVVTDPGVSAGKPLSDREGGRRVLEMARRRKVSAVVAYKLDRLFRDTSDALSVTREWDRKNVSLHLVDMGGQTIDTGSAMGRFFLTMMAGFAELERNTTAERTRAAMAHKRARGQRTSKDAPFGYRIADDGKMLIEDEAEQEVIKRVLYLRDEGKSQREIAEVLNESDVPARGSRWHQTTISRLLRREATSAQSSPL